MTGRMQPVVCPVCHTKQDGFMPIATETDMPEPGAIMLCFFCTTVNELQENWTLRAVVGEELDTILNEDDELFQAVMAVRLLRMLTADTEE